jgi:hypothetical protein
MDQLERWICALAPGEELLWKGCPARRGDITVYQLTDRRLIITSGRRHRSSTSFYLDQLPTARLIRTHGPPDLEFDAGLVRPGPALFARSRQPMTSQATTEHGVLGDAIGGFRLTLDRRLPSAARCGESSVRGLGGSAEGA